MAFLHQLRLLLWKNGLGIIRQPLWSLTLIIWPLIIFIIIAVTRHQFPPVVKTTCYAGPRNLPSTGFFPFLQTLMCNKDSHCHNTSQLVDQTESKTNQRASVHQSPRSSPWEGMMGGEEALNFLKDPKKEPAALVKALLDIVGTSNGGRHYNASFMNMNASLFGDNETLLRMLESANTLKKVICLMALPMMNTSSPSPVSHGVLTFCESNKTVFEVTLSILDEVLSGLIITRPDDVATIAGMALAVFDQLQDHTSLWQSLLALPDLFSSGSIDQIFDSAESLLSNIQSAMRTIEKKFPEAGVPLSMLDPAFAVGLRIIHHAQKWPGADVSIPLKEVVIMHNDSISEMVRQALPQIEIPLEKAIALTLDRNMVHTHLCTNANNPMWLTAACSTGTVGVLLDWISPEKVAQQALLAWSKHVASHDLAFAKELLQGLMGESTPGEQGGPSITRTRRSVETQPENIEEELFLAVGQVVLEIIENWPEVDAVVHGVLRSGLQSMKIATLTIETVDEIITDVLQDADQLKEAFLMLMTNQTEANMLVSDVLGSVVEVIMKVLRSESLTCENVLEPFDWLLDIETIGIQGLTSMICDNGTDLQQAVLMVLMPLIESAEDFNNTIMGDADNNVNLPVILSAWKKMYNNIMQFIGLVGTLTEELGGAYWMSWMPDNSTYDVTETLQQSALMFMVHLGQTIEKSHLWPEVKDYFHMVNWILSYKPDDAASHNCFLNIYNMTLQCNTDSEFNWLQFVPKMIHTLTSADQDIVVNSLKGAVNLLQEVYRDTVKFVIGSFLKESIKGGEGLSSFLINLMKNLQSFINELSMLPDEDITDLDEIKPLVANLLHSSGLTPLLPLISGDGHVNVSTALHAAIKFLRDNQHIFTFNETDPTMPELGRLIMDLLSLKGNLSISLPNIMGSTLLTYAGYLNPEDVARLQEAIRPFTNQTSAGIVEAILRSMELLESVIDPNGDPADAVLEYVRQLQDFIMSVLKLGRFHQSLLPNGELSAAKFTDLHLASKEILSLLTPESIQSLIQAGPDAALDAVIEKLVKVLPAEVQKHAVDFLQELKALQHLLAKCASGHDCLDGISDIFEFLDQILETMLGAEFDVKIAVLNPLTMGKEYQEIASSFFSLLLSPHDAAYVKTFKQALNFISLALSTPNATISDIQAALKQSNLTLEDLKELTSIFGAANIDDLQEKIVDVINSQKCFELQHNQMVAPQCVMGLINGITGVLTQLPALKNQTAILSLIPYIVNNTISDVNQANFSSNPNEAVIHTLKTTLANVKIALHRSHLYTPEVMSEIRVLEGLIQLAANQEALSDIFNDTLTKDPVYAQKVYLEVVHWYLERLEDITKESLFSDIFHPFLRLITMQVKLQLAQTDFSVLLSNHIEYLVSNIQHPIDGTGVNKIGQTVVELLHHLLKLIRGNLEVQNNLAGMDHLNVTALHIAEHQIKLYLSIIEDCFELQQDQMVAPKCVDGLTNGVAGVLSQLPNLQNETAILNLIHQIINKTVTDVSKMNFSSDPDEVVIHTLNKTLANVKTALQLNQLYTPEVMTEIRVLENLIQLVTNREALGKIFNNTLLSHPTHARKVYLEVVHWYLEGLINITRESSLAEPIQPYLHFALMQVKLQMAQTDFELLLTNKIQYLMSNIQHPIDGAGLSEVGQTAVEIAQHLFKLIKGNLEFQNKLSGMQLFNTTVLDKIGHQINFYLDVIQGWMEHPKVPLVLSSMLRWGNITNASTPLKDIHHLLETIIHFLSGDQQAFLSLPGDIIESLSNALLAAEQPGGLQSKDFLDAVEEAFSTAMQILTAANVSLPHSVEQNIRDMVQYSLELILQPDMNFDNSRNISLKILERAEDVLKELLPVMIKEYLLPGIKAIATYFESSLTASGPDVWNQIILDEMKLIQSLLPPNSTAQVYISTLINITSSILGSDQGDINLWTLLEKALDENFLHSLNVSDVIDPIKDLQHLLMQTLVHLLDKEQQAYLSLISSITQSLENVLMVAEQPGGLLSQESLDTLVETFENAMQILTTNINVSLPHSVEQNILGMVQYSLKLILQADVNSNNSLMILLKLLEKAVDLINEVVPDMITEHLIFQIKETTTWYENILAGSEPDVWGHIILDEMKLIQSSLPSNTTARVYISTLINITSSILESDQGNVSLWILLEKAFDENGLHWGNFSNSLNPLKDFHHLLRQQMVHFLNKERQTLFSLIGNMSQSLGSALMLAEQPGGLQKEEFVDALVEALQSALQFPSPLFFIPIELVEDEILDIVQYSLKLILQPDMNFDNSRNISLKLLDRAADFIDELLPEVVTDYLLPGIKVLATFFESSLTASGPDVWNQIILDEMKLIQSLLPPNSTAQLYISTLIDITGSILESDQGYMNLWTLLEKALDENFLHSLNISDVVSPIKDLQHLLMQTIVHLLNEEQQTYLSLIGNLTQSVGNVLMAAEQIGTQSDEFLDALVETVHSTMQILTVVDVHLSHSLEQNTLEIVQYSLKLILQPDMNFDNSRKISLKLLDRAADFIDELLPEVVTDYLLPGIKMIVTFFESSLTASGPDVWNQIILAEMKTIQSFLPPNTTAQVYISTLIDITSFILESEKGNMSLWRLFENASEENVPLIIGKMGKLLSMLWPLITGGQGPHPGPPSLEGFAHLTSVLDHIFTGRADEATWDKLEEIIEALLSFIEGTELWDSVTPVVPLFEKIVATLVNNMQAENALIHSLQMPVMTLMKEIIRSVNSSHLNLTEVSERMQDAIEHTVQAAQLANGSLTCSEVLEIWDPTREAAGLSYSTVSEWCNINLQPVLEAFDKAQIVFGHMNMSHMGVKPMMVNAAAARIVRTLQSVYDVSINRTVMAEKLIMAFSSQLSVLTGQPLSPEAHKHWNKQLQEMQLLNSLSSLRMLSEELLMVAPDLRPYIRAGEKALGHILANYHQIQDESSFEDVFEQAVQIFLHGAGITSEDITSLMNLSDLDKDSLAYMIQEAVKHLMKLLQDAPMVSQGLEHFLSSNDTRMMVEEASKLVAWLTSSKKFHVDQLEQVLTRVFHILKPLFSALTKMFMDRPAHTELFEELADNIAAMVEQIMSTSGLFGPMDYQHGVYMQEMKGGNHTRGLRRKRESPMIPMRSPMDDFIDLFHIDYHTMFKAMSVYPSDEEILETFHLFFANPDLGIVMKGATQYMPWYLNVSREDTIDAALNILSYFTHPHVFDKSFWELLMNAAKMLPDGFLFVPEIKAIIKAFVEETEENLLLIEETFQTAAELLHFNLTDPAFIQQLGHLKSKVCTVEETKPVHLLMTTVGVEPGFLCDTLIPALQFLVKTLTIDMATLTEALFETIIGDPSTYNVSFGWTSVLSGGMSFNISSLSSLNINITSPGAVAVGEMLRNKTAFVEDVQRHLKLDPAALQNLMETTLPNNNLVILSWLVNLRHCDSINSVNMNQADLAFLKTFCSMPFEDWYRFSLLMAHHLNIEKLIFRFVLSEELQSVMEVMLQMAEVVINMLDKIVPAVEQIQSYMSSIEDIDSLTSSEYHHMARVQRSTDSNRASFVTLSRALCSNGIVALFGLAKLPLSTDNSDPSAQDDPQREEMIERFKLPRNASPFCMNMYLDMVNTTGGAIAWAFLKPMLMGHILYTPDTPVTRDIMEKSKATLQELDDLRKHSGEWIESSGHVLKAAQILGRTLPMLQNSLGNSFVKNFIEMQTDINVGTMKETLSNFSNVTLMLEKNRDMLDQITTLSTLMVNLSSCIEFDRYRAYDSEEQLNADAEDLAKNRDLYASVIFKLPKDSDSSRKRRATSSLPPKVSYTIRMHMDNVMRSDRVRDPFFVKDPHISASLTMRYNRGFIYLQETIDRAIIATQTGQSVTETAVQLQPFPYPCHLRDEYLEAISFVFPLMLMLAWVLFVADFVKKLVYERELRLHEYMKMMGVNPLSHFFAWFLESATYLLATITILTIVLREGGILPHSNGFLLFLYLCDYGLSILAFSFLVSSFFDKTFIAGLSGSLLYILSFFPFIVVMAVERTLTFSQKSLLSLFSPTCFSYASQYISRYESQGEGIQWSNSYTSPIAGDTASFGWLCWLMLIDALLYFIIGAYIRMVFPGKYGIPAPWYFPFKKSFWAELFLCVKPNNKPSTGLLFTNIMQQNQPVFLDDKGKGESTLSSLAGESYSHLPVGVALHGLTKMYGDQVAIHNLNVSFYESHVTSLLGHNGAGKTTTMSLLTGLFAPTSGSIEVYGRDMQSNIDDIRKELGVCMQYDVLFDHMTTKEHLLLYGQIKAPHWSKRVLREQVRTILEETGMYAHRHKRVGTLSGGMKRKLSISIAFIGGSRLVVLDEPTTGVDPCSRRAIWDIVIQHKKQRTIIMSTHHLDEAEVLSDRITFLERGGLKCCGSPFYLKDKLGQGYKLTLTKKLQNPESEKTDNADLKNFIQAHIPEARLKEAQGGDLVYSLPPFTSSNASAYRSLLTALDSNLDALQLGGYGVSDTTLEEVYLQLAHDNTEPGREDTIPSISETVSDTGSISSFPSDDGGVAGFSDNIKLTSSTNVSGAALAWQQLVAMLTKRIHHSRRDWKGLIAQIVLPVLFMVFAMGLGSIKNDLQHYPELELSPALYKFGPSYSFFSNSNPNSEKLSDAMMSFPGIDNSCLNEPDNPVCSQSRSLWRSSGNSSKAFSGCKCTRQEQICEADSYQPPHKTASSSHIVYNLSGINVEQYLVSTANDFIRNRYGGFAFGMPLPADLKMDLKTVPENRTLSKVWFNPEGHHTMPAYLNSINNLILRANLPADKDPRKYAISVSSHPYFGRADDEDAIVQGMLQILVAMCVLTGYSITTASFAGYVVNEHHSGFKRLQHIAGISEPFYWAVNFFYDMVVYMIPVTLTVGVIAAFQIPAFTDRQNLGAVTLLLVLFGFATFPWMYLISGIFKDVEMAFITYVCINLFISINTILSTSILYFLSQISTIKAEVIQVIFTKLCNAFLIFPQFNFGHGMMQLARKNIQVQILSGYGIDAYQNPFSTEALGWLFISSFIQGLVFFSLRLLLNKSLMRKVRRLICGRRTVPHVVNENEDEDVATEHLRVSSGAAGSDILQVNQLTKVYQNLNKKVHAVKRVSVGIPAGECFGLLGVNGAGKTTTFKMLTGDVSPTDGTAQIRDRNGRLIDIMECRNQGINIGYCPQVDALDNLLTGEEHLYFYARIRGISKREIDGVVRYLLKRLELNYHRNITTEGYSCGTRRKLSTALALIGHPHILLLDEPSSGMDPHTKRHLWKILSEEVKGKCAVVLTSHSMEECEALCSRLAIMVKGQFRCLGSLQHIKNRFGSGFTVKMYLAEASCDVEAITGLMQRRFPSTYLKDQHSNMVEYHVPVAPGGVADIFDQLESNKNTLRIKHFSVSQTTLDEVFINFAMEKNDMESVQVDNQLDGSDVDSLDSFNAVKT